MTVRLQPNFQAGDSRPQELHSAYICTFGSLVNCKQSKFPENKLHKLLYSRHTGLPEESLKSSIVFSKHRCS